MSERAKKSDPSQYSKVGIKPTVPRKSKKILISVFQLSSQQWAKSVGSAKMSEVQAFTWEQLFPLHFLCNPKAQLEQSNLESVNLGPDLV